MFRTIVKVNLLARYMGQLVETQQNGTMLLPFDELLRISFLLTLDSRKTDMSLPLLHVVLYQPDIPQNTGNIGRTCVAVGAKLWLVRPLGFRLDEKHVRRAGMDYWPLLDWEAVDNLHEVQEKLPGRNWWCLTKSGERLVWEAEFAPGDVLVFGSETRGLPASLLERQSSRNLRLPMYPSVRSLNLASTVNTVVYEAVRQFGGLP